MAVPHPARPRSPGNCPAAFARVAFAAGPSPSPARAPPAALSPAGTGGRRWRARAPVPSLGRRGKGG
eukprot:11440844-Alexandrium_andersonii.AAC.1